MTALVLPRATSFSRCPTTRATLAPYPTSGRPRLVVWEGGHASRRQARAYAAPPPRQEAVDEVVEAKKADRRLRDLLGRVIKDDYAKLRERYDSPKHPIVLAHGLLGFSELRLLGEYLPALHYWRGIKEALLASHAAHSQDAVDAVDAVDPVDPATGEPPRTATTAPKANQIPRVITTSVPPSSSIEDRAQYLARDILTQLGSPSQPITVNIVAHSMGGLDARFLISRLRVPNLRVASLVTIATPHRGSAVADYFIHGPGASVLSPAFPALRRAGLGTEAFSQLTCRYICDTFNQETPDVDAVRYFSYGASIGAQPGLLNPFRGLWMLLSQKEGPNDGLVSVPSARWGEYKGTLVGVTHLDLINWTNRFGWTVREWLGAKRTFNAVAFYLSIADMLAKEGL